MLQCAHHTFKFGLSISAFSTLVMRFGLFRGSHAVMKQQIRNDRLSNESSDHDTFQRFVHLRMASPFLDAAALAHSLGSIRSTFDGNEEGLGNSAAPGGNTRELASVHS
jgi:hypothetical protein